MTTKLNITYFTLDSLPTNKVKKVSTIAYGKTRFIESGGGNGFVNSGRQLVAEQANRYRLNTLPIHGGLTAGTVEIVAIGGYCRGLKEGSGKYLKRQR